MPIEENIALQIHLRKQNIDMERSIIWKGNCIKQFLVAKRLGKKYGMEVFPSELVILVENSPGVSQTTV